MWKRNFLIGLLILVPAVAFAWQVGNAELDNVELHDDLRDVAAQNGVNSGLNSPKTDDEIRQQICETAAEHGLKLRPDEVTLTRYQNGTHIHFDVAVDYTIPINLLLYSYKLHFVQTSAKK